MPTGSDKATASIPIEGRAATIRLRRPRPDCDGLYLFGHRHRGQEALLTDADRTPLRSGRTLAIDVWSGRTIAINVLGEYVIYLRRTPETADEPE